MNKSASSRISRIKRWVHALVLCVVMMAMGAVHASELQNHEVRIFVTEESEQIKRVVEVLQAKYPAAQVVSELPSPSASAKKRKPVYIAVGPASLRALLAKEPDGAIFSLFVSNQSYNAISQSASRTRANGITAIYADPAPADQLRLIAKLYKRRIPVAVLLSEKTAHLTLALNQAAAKADLDLTIELAAPEDNLNRILSRVSTAPVLLAIPDGTIYNSDNIRNILMTTYRANQALIGFSPSMVKAGALATTYSNTDDVVAQLGDMLNEFDVSGRPPEPQFPKYFSVIVNDNVARSLNVLVDEETRAMSRKPAAR
jgi:hypothetical protein